MFALIVININANDLLLPKQQCICLSLVEDAELCGEDGAFLWESWRSMYLLYFNDLLLAWPQRGVAEG